ncbi:MAG TPA: hypothetical protein VN420_05400 [Candidatus Fimivivens sp.]|nr:hypothetical protein [Candidatus Fimivivens sp.]
MIFFRPDTIVPPQFRTSYRAFRVALFASFIVTTALFTYRTLFPSQDFTYSFVNPDTAKNTLEDPATTLRKGRISANETLRTYAGTVGSFSTARIRIVLRKDSAIPNTGSFTVSVRKSFRSFFYPEGSPLSAMPTDRGVIVNGNPYLFSGDTLQPFVSDRAALSYFAKDKLLAANADLLTIIPPQETLVGFRPGSLLSDTQGVYGVGGDGKVHPIGTTQIFEALGFHWKDVVPVNEEELGFHKRGKIMLFDAAQPDGTVFRDTVTGTYSVISDARRLPIRNTEYLDSLLNVTTPIDASSDSLSITSACTPVRTTFSFLHPTFTCDIPLEALKTFPGESFEVSLSSSDVDLHADSLSMTLMTKPDRGNLEIFLHQLRDRFSAAYGQK